MSTGIASQPLRDQVLAVMNIAAVGPAREKNAELLDELLKEAAKEAASAALAREAAFLSNVASVSGVDALKNAAERLWDVAGWKTWDTARRAAAEREVWSP